MGAEVKFKVGDRVRCVDPAIGTEITHGEYVVSRVTSEFVYLNGLMGGYYPFRFELVEPEDYTCVELGTAEPPCTHTDVTGGTVAASVVHRPAHYTRNVIEPIEFIMKNKMEFWRGCVVKYTARAGYKLYDGLDAVQSEIVDHKKSIRYLQMRVLELEGNEEFAK